MAKKKQIEKKKNGTFIPNPDGRPETYTPQQIMDAYKETKGFKSTAAKLLKCTVQTLLNYESRYPEIKEYWLNEVKYKRDDFVESKLMNLINDNNVATTIFYAKTQMKDRGYIEYAKTDTQMAFLIQYINNLDLRELSDEQIRNIAAGRFDEILTKAANTGDNGNGMEIEEATSDG